MTATQDAGLVEVRLLQVPLPLLIRAQERSDELSREFSHVADSDSEGAPARLLALSQHLSGRYGGYMQPVQDDIAAAIARGDETIDVSFKVPRDVSSAASRLWALLDEADEFCRSGDLLTLATPPEIVMFRRWYLTQFMDQVDGAEPVSWDRYAASAGD